MSSIHEITDLASALSAIQILTAEKAGIEEIISGIRNEWALSEAALNSILAQLESQGNKQHLQDSKSAWQLSIQAYKLSIEVYQGDIATNQSEMNKIYNIFPEAKSDQ